jgi:pimaricinolide synthase PimS1
MFAEAFDDVYDQLDLLLKRPLRQVMFAQEGSAEAAMLDQTHYTELPLFAVEVALFRLLTGWGVPPDYLVGPFIGELGAAHVAGVLSPADAAKLVHEQ